MCLVRLHSNPRCARHQRTARAHRVRHSVCEHHQGVSSRCHVAAPTALNGVSVRALQDVLVSIGGVLGGSSAYYTQLQHETAEHALHTMVHSAQVRMWRPARPAACCWLTSVTTAQELGANAVLRVRFEPNLVMNRLVFGVHSSSFCFGTVSTHAQEAVRARD